MGIKLVIFDLDGTLIDAFRPVAESLNYAMGRLGYPQQDEEMIKRSVGWGERKLLSKFVKPEDIPVIVEVYREHHQHTLRAETEFLPCAKELLYKLKSEGYRMGIATNRPQWSTQVILEALEIKTFFGHVMSGDIIPNPKPAPDMIFKIMEELDAAPNETMFVGDMVIDIEAGQRAGVKTVGVTTGTMTRAELEAFDADHVIEKLDGLWPILNGAPGSDKQLKRP
jgi:phosphoglycolate phosphatase